LQNSDSSDSLFVVGSLDERILIRGMHYYPYCFKINQFVLHNLFISRCDIEATVNRSHRIISERCVASLSRSILIFFYLVPFSCGHIC
jgi:hypothetical protein